MKENNLYFITAFIFIAIVLVTKHILDLMPYLEPTWLVQLGIVLLGVNAALLGTLVLITLNLKEKDIESIYGE